MGRRGAGVTKPGAEYVPGQQKALVAGAMTGHKRWGMAICGPISRLGSVGDLQPYCVQIGFLASLVGVPTYQLQVVD